MKSPPSVDKKTTTIKAKKLKVPEDAVVYWEKYYGNSNTMINISAIIYLFALFLSRPASSSLLFDPLKIKIKLYLRTT